MTVTLRHLTARNSRLNATFGVTWVRALLLGCCGASACSEGAADTGGAATAEPGLTAEPSGSSSSSSSLNPPPTLDSGPEPSSDPPPLPSVTLPVPAVTVPPSASSTPTAPSGDDVDFGGSGGGAAGDGGASAGSPSSAAGAAAIAGSGGTAGDISLAAGAGGGGGASGGTFGSGGEIASGGQLSRAGAGGASAGGAGSGGAAGSSSTPTEGCPKAGNVTYAFNDVGAFPTDALERLTQALDEAIWYYNCYSDLSHSLTINYKPSVPTAEANVDGWISFGSDRNYMVVATVMHEIGHTMGVGFSPWSELIVDGRWSGQNVVDLMASIPAEERDAGEGGRDYITCDSQHFWPYGLNYASEHESEWSLINHVRIVDAMNRDKDPLR